MNGVKLYQLSPVWHALWLRCKADAEIADRTAAEHTKHGGHGQAAIARERASAMRTAMGWIAEAATAAPPPPAPPAPVPEVEPELLMRCRIDCGGKWPERLTSGVMFYGGARITRQAFEGRA